MDLSTPAGVRDALRLAGIKPNKSLGQHFLVDHDSLKAIVGAAEIGPEDTVLEVGPGLGVMTRALEVRASRVIAVETDRILADLLRRDAPANLTVIESDILKYDLSALPAGYKVVANIPYYLTSKLIRNLVEAPAPPAVMSLLIQKEVAERIVAAPGKMSLLALSVQYYAEADVVAGVPRDRFWPAPEVDSAVLRIRFRGPAFEADADKLFRLMKAGFGEKRKQLKNALSGGLHIEVADASALIAAAGLGPLARAQELSLGDWSRLYGVTVASGYLA